ncbi:MAG: SRPBCC family protein [Chloroflexota bacterium]
MSTFEVTTTIDAPPDKVWQALADIGNIHQWNPGVVDSHVNTEQMAGVGAGRHCNLGGKNYLDETVVAWEDEKRLTMRIIGTNMPFKSADIRFTLLPQNEATEVTVSPIYELKFGILGQMMDAVFVHRTYKKGMGDLLDGLKQFVEKDG